MKETNNQITHVDCTLRDGGYYNDWNFDKKLVQDYLTAMAALQIDFVEIGFRTTKNKGFKGWCAYSTDDYLYHLPVPIELKDKIGVMINGAELLPDDYQNSDEETVQNYCLSVLESLFKNKRESPVTLVRIACHTYEISDCLPAVTWLKEQGYTVGINLMQIADKTMQDIKNIAKIINKYPVDTLYFADSMGSLDSEQLTSIVKALRYNWGGDLGIHTHDNLGQAIAITTQAIKEGVTWVDSTVTGMGRGPGNAQTEYLAIVLEEYRNKKGNITKLLELVHKHFKPMQSKYGWGTNPYYYLAGKYGIHPSYVQEMLSDHRYNEEDILAVIDHLRIEGGKKFSFGTLEAARHFYSGDPRGSWDPGSAIKNKDVLIIGAGPSAIEHKYAIEKYIKTHNPYVISLNTQSSIDENIIDARAACHPVRLLADCSTHLELKQPLITPASMLPSDIKQELKDKTLLDFGISIKADVFEFHDNYCTLPTSLVIAYALAIATSGEARKIYLAGFDGYSSDDPRRKEMDLLFKQYEKAQDALPVISVTPSLYEIEIQSIYAMIE